MLAALQGVTIPAEDSLQVDFSGDKIDHLNGGGGREDLVHYYTGNHLSSTQLVTDGTGVVVQMVEYAPFGEVVNEYNIDWSNGQVPDFKFNAKELDEENGMYYFEARYQSPPVFISRDVLFEKYPMFSPYSYCFNNPIKYVDPTGEDGEIAIDAENKTITVRANFYYNETQLEQGKNFSVKNAFQGALDAWSSDIKTAISEMGFENYNVDVQFNMINVDIGDATGQDAINIIKTAANADPIGNSITHDDRKSSGATVTGNKHLWADMKEAAHDDAVFFGTDETNPGTARHEIGHLLGLRDRYNTGTGENAPYIPNDLMTNDYSRTSGVAPFKRIMNNNLRLPMRTQKILLNSKNREPKR
jgi:RHS repeat-associated protein